eukprot:XP_011679536.1 PREDICTED: uncharacterized protein LOC754455 [Strongylocentrotus purpuratus]
MSKWLGSSSQDETNKTELSNRNALSSKLSDFGVPNSSINRFLETCDASHLFSYFQEPESKRLLMELLSLASTPPSTELGDQEQVAIPSRAQSVHETNRKSNNLIMECSEQLRLHYMDCSNILKVALRPSTKDKIHNVEDLHVPVALKKSEISPDLPQMAEIQAIDFFKEPNFKKKRILMFGPHGVGKTTEIKMWLYNWCRKISGPLMAFPLVFYIDGAKLGQGTNLGEAVTNQCLPGESAFKPEDIESMCQDCKDEILVILDNYPKWKPTDRLKSSLEAMVLMRKFPHLTLLVATTSGGLGHFREVYGIYDHVQVEGISERSVSTYISNVFKNRREFGSKVEEYLRNTEQVHNMAASPVLLSIMCQIVKFCANPTLLGDLKTVSALMDRFIDCIIMRHAEDGDSNITMEKSGADGPDTGADETSAMSALSLRSRVQTRSARPTTLRSQSGCQETSLSKNETIKQLSAVAFSCYLKGDDEEERHLSEGDFHDVCGELKTEVIEEGCRLGLLVKSSIDEFIPSSQKAVEGKVIGFLSPLFQQRLGAKHFAKLLQGNHEEKQMFRNSLTRIGSIENALSLRSLLSFACGESMKTARSIIGHVVDLTLAYAGDMYPDPRPDEEVLGQAHVQYHDMIKFILDLNYEARSDGRLNDILCPLVTQLRILSPSVIMTRSLAYLLEHVATPNTPKLDEVDIEVFDVPPEIQDNLPHHKSIIYKYEEDAPVSIERGAFGDASAGGAASLSPSSLMSTTKRRLSIKVNQERTKGNKRCTLAPTFPPPSIQVVEEDRAFPFRGSVTSSPAQPGRHHRAQTSNVCRPVPKREIAEIVDLSQYSIDKSKCISFGGYGEVYEGKWKGKRVAVKRVEKVEESDTSSLEREIKINAWVKHPNIVVLHAFSKFQPGMTSHLCFDLIMDLIDGFTLNDAVFVTKLENLQTDRGKLTTAMKVSDAIAHIHSIGLTHSDIKPDNILIRISDNEPFVCDLGLGHAVTLSKNTSSGKLVNHPNIVVLHAFAKFQPGRTSDLCCDLIMELIDGFTLNDAVFKYKLKNLVRKPTNL